MTDDETVAVIFEVARSAGIDLSEHQRTLLNEVIAKGFVAKADDLGSEIPRFKVTPAGQVVLDERGVGANES